MIDDPDLSSKDLLQVHQGPRLPHRRRDPQHARRAARRSTRPARARCGCAASTSVSEKSGASVVIITSIPYTTNKARIVEEIAEHIVSRRLPQATDVRDESTDIVRVVVEIKPDASPEAVMAYVFKHTSLQINFNVNLTALVPTATPGVGQPARLTLRDLCRHFLDFRLEVVTRRLDARAARAARAAAHPRRLPQAVRQPRPRHQDHPPVGVARRRREAADEGVRRSTRSRPTRSSRPASTSWRAWRSRRSARSSARSRSAPTRSSAC